MNQREIIISKNQTLKISKDIIFPNKHQSDRYLWNNILKFLYEVPLVKPSEEMSKKIIDAVVENKVTTNPSSHPKKKTISPSKAANEI